MNTKILEKLSEKARDIMSKSADPIHDLDHVNRVLNNANRIMDKMALAEKDKESVRLASLWHDVGRTITSKPSFVWMILLDDMISAFMLWRETSKYQLFSSVSSLAGRIILCKSLGTGKILTKLLLNKKNRQLLDIVQDADNLDIINQERLQKAMESINNGTMPMLTYKIITWYCTRMKTIKVKTEVAKQILIEVIKQLIHWLQKIEIQLWHINHLGKKWCKKMKKRIENLMANFINIHEYTLASHFQL